MGTATKREKKDSGFVSDGGGYGRGGSVCWWQRGGSTIDLCRHSDSRFGHALDLLVNVG